MSNPPVHATDPFLLLLSSQNREQEMPFLSSCSIDGCLKLCEPEIRLSLFPKTKKRALTFDMQQLKQRKELTVVKINELAIREERETDSEVAAWMKNVDDLGVEIDELLKSLSTNRCWHLRANYKNGRDVDEMRRRIETLGKTRDKWDDDPNKLLKPKAPQVSAPDANGIPKVSSTAQEEARMLFSSYLMGGATDLTRNPFLEQHARDIVDTLERCCGSSNQTLDLAMRVVAASLKNHSAVGKWEEAAEKLRSIAASTENIISDGTPMVERILRFCYDRMGSERLRDCLSSCASFDCSSSSIAEFDIIYSWMGEGLLDDTVADFDKAYEQGRHVIDELKGAHWFRSSNRGDFFLTMDNHIQCMVRKASGHMVMPSSSTAAEGRELQCWRDSKAARVLVKHPVSSLPNSTHAFAEAHLPEGTPVCPHLISLLLRRNESFTRIHDDFFRFTPQLLVLDLSYTNVEALPRSIGLLKSLRLLKLTKTRLRSLPVELGDVEDLRQLEMHLNKELKEIHRECITKLSKLQALNMIDNGHGWNQPAGSASLSLEDLQDMAGIQRLSLTARTDSDLEKMRNLFGTNLTGLTVEWRDLTDAHSVMSSLNRLELFELNNCTRLEDLVIGNGHLGRVRSIVLDSLHIKTIAPEPPEEGGSRGGFECFLPTLRLLVIKRCHSLRNLTWMGHLPKLEFIHLEDCEEMTMLIDGGRPGDSSTVSEERDGGGVSFPNLQYLVLVQLPWFIGFSRRHPLRLPSLRTLKVRRCPQLKKLPFGRSSCKDIKYIHGAQGWWDQLQWDHSDIQGQFGAYFKPYA